MAETDPQMQPEPGDTVQWTTTGRGRALASRATGVVEYLQDDKAMIVQKLKPKGGRLEHRFLKKLSTLTVIKKAA